MRIGIFEDSGYKNLQPLTYLRPTFDLRCGMYLLREKITYSLPGLEQDLYVRKSIEKLVAFKNPGLLVNKTGAGEYLFINGRAIIPKISLYQMIKVKQSLLFKKQDEIVAARVLGTDLDKLKQNPDGTLNFDDISEWRPAGQDVKLLKYTWDLVSENGKENSQNK